MPTCIHFDVMDGAFVPNISFGLPVLKAVREYTDAMLDVHLMIEKPERYIDDFAAAGADLHLCPSGGRPVPAVSVGRWMPWTRLA